VIADWVRFFLDEQKEMNILKKKEGVPFETPSFVSILVSG
jgi:hypothetical protein